MNRKEKGIILPVVIAFIVIFAIVGFAVLTIAQQEIIQARIDVDKTKAFYYAEGGLAKLSEALERTKIKDLGGLLTGEISQGDYHVDIDTNGASSYAVSTGKSGVIQKKIRVKLNFLAPPFEDAIYATNNAGGDWSLQLRGSGSPVVKGKTEQSGKDIVSGNIFVDGDVRMYDQSSVIGAPAPNQWQLNGDVEATGNIAVAGSANISGAKIPNSEEPEEIDLVEMDYANNNTYNISKIFEDAGVSSGTLPSKAPLRDVFIKNPSDRGKETSTTAVNDYFLEPMAATGGGNYRDATTPLHLGNNVIYYVDGDLWIHSLSTYGFLVDGKATVVVTGNIHISDNIKYKDDDSVLGLIALGKYDSSGNRISGGDIFFGDPRYGTMYEVSAMMFAGHDFLYNTDSVTHSAEEPTTGFKVNGNFSASNRVSVERDWYTQDGGRGNDDKVAAAAHFDAVTGTWKNSQTGKALTASEISSLRHYQMIVNYDERVRASETQPPGLPRGNGSIFTGFTQWEEL